MRCSSRRSPGCRGIGDLIGALPEHRITGNGSEVREALDRTLGDYPQLNGFLQEAAE